jgi:hypothetical protein
VASNYGGNVSGNTGKVRFPAKAGAEYQIAVDGYASGYEGIVKLSLVSYPVDAPLEISLQPKNATVKGGRRRYLQYRRSV